MKISANISLLFSELPLLSRIGAAAESGFDGIEIQFPYEVSAESLKRELDRCSMPLALINMPAGDLLLGGTGIAASPNEFARFDCALQLALQYAKIVRPRAINVLAGRLAIGVDRELALETLSKNLRQAASAFSELGVLLTVEAINPVDMAGYLINSPESLVDMLSRVSHPNCFAQVDIYHMEAQGYSAEHVSHLLSGKIGHVQFADFPGRGEPGSGNIAFSAWVKMLEKAKYKGFLGAEYHPSSHDVGGGGWQWLYQWKNNRV